jgi:hypothetical protein
VPSLAAPALLADLYGTTEYASIAGILALPVTISRATAPPAAALLLHTARSPQPLEDVDAWLAAQRALWTRRLDQLDSFLYDLKEQQT